MKISKPQKIDFNSISTIIFDWGGVIIDLDVNKSIEAFSKLGHPNFDKYLNPDFEDNIYFRFEEGRATTAEFYAHLRTEMNVQHSDEKIDEALSAMLGNTPVEHLDLLKKLGNKYSLMLLSNTNPVHANFCNEKLLKTRNIDFPSYFHKVYYSYNLDCRKPGTEIFEKVLDKNSLVPSQTLFLDDSEINIESARSLGINTIHITKENSLLHVFKDQLN